MRSFSKIPSFSRICTIVLVLVVATSSFYYSSAQEDEEASPVRIIHYVPADTRAAVDGNGFTTAAYDASLYDNFYTQAVDEDYYDDDEDDDDDDEDVEVFYTMGGKYGGGFGLPMPFLPGAILGGKGGKGNNAIDIIVGVPTAIPTPIPVPTAVAAPAPQLTYIQQPIQQKKAAPMTTKGGFGGGGGYY